MENKRKISIIGSTGSIGTQALEVIDKIRDRFEIIALAGGSNVELLKKQAEKYQPKLVSSSANPELLAGNHNAKILTGMDGLEEICSNRENDIILVACSGKIGLRPTLKAIENGIDIALANKETLVMAGDIVMAKAKKHGVKIIPVDSEHCAIHQCIKDISQVDKLIITASGGPFLHKTVDEMKNATVKEALAHPRWNMGRKITVDSATLMNKGLEIIEAHHLFGFDYDDIEVVVHPQSIVHSAIEYKDGSVIAQLGLPSMHIPIQYAITYPERYEGIKSKSFSFAEIARLDFEKPDFEKFPTVKLAYNAGKIGGTATVCLNAANEEAVFAFLDGKIKLYEIYEITKKIYDEHKVIQTPTIDEIFEVDEKIREKTKDYIAHLIQKVL
ncbi:1-deoxy-D-xylulose-5-phosphate reductoisomerase [Spirochaetes bacterium]|uniref:1-deoxy-D-xylulose 5-phosphate reductoisomerase n=1 Tax=Candidatus Scatousia excrementipullorum TaxID=2840936 RepID=A0A9D9H1K5_9BACT|nr:1-deoxy-D-xylulose-5-phosphate reductoisomerase [Candidatus Scatousia excrementipullorum]